MEQLIRVFIADSSRDGALLLRDTLEQEADLAVVGAVWRGDEALDQFPGSGADVLLCDLLLPGLDGLGLLRRLKTAGVLRHSVVLSGFFNDRIARAVSALADDYLPKPCAAQELVRHIRACALGSERPFAVAARAAIRQALLTVCILPHLDGFRYMRSALERTWADPSLLSGVTKALYRDVAREFSTNPACVERSMRAAIGQAWALMGADVKLRVFGPQAAARAKAPSNVPFLAAMTAWLDGQSGVFRSRG